LSAEYCRAYDPILLEYYNSQKRIPLLYEWLREWARWTVQLVKVTVKVAMTWIKRRNDRWHYKSACRAIKTEGASPPGKGQAND